MVQGRQPPESLQYMDTKFALERGIGVKFCISLITEFSLYYLTLHSCFQRSRSAPFRKNRRHPSA